MPTRAPGPPIADYGSLSEFLLGPARAYAARPPQTQSLGLLGDIHNAIDPAQAFGGYGGLLAMAVPPGSAKLPGMATSRPRTFWRGETPGNSQRIKTGNDSWDSHLFAADNKDAASLYGKQLTRLDASPDAKILYEGTKDFVTVAGRWRKGENLLDYASRAAEAAKRAGYDALWFKRQGDVGTAIFNPEKFVKTR